MQQNLVNMLALLKAIAILFGSQRYYIGSGMNASLARRRLVWFLALPGMIRA